MPVSVYTSFQGGVNEQLGPIISEPDPSGLIQQGLFYADASQNWECSEAGLIKMSGVSAVLSSALPDKVTGLFKFNGSELVATCATGKIYSVSGTSAIEIYSGATVNSTFTGCMYRDALILCNGVDGPLRYDGSTCTAISMTDPNSLWQSAKPKGAFVFRNSLYYWGDTVYKSRVYKPDPYSIGGSNGYSNFTFSTGGVEVFDVIGQGDLIGAQPLSDDICLLFKTDCIIRMSGSTPFAGDDPIALGVGSEQVGCVATKSIQPVGGDIFFLSQNGLRKISTTQRYGDIELQNPTYNILPSTLSALNQINKGVSACGFLPKTNSLYFAFPTGSNSNNSAIVVYDVATNTCQPMSGVVATCFVEQEGALYFGSTDGQIYQLNSGYSYGGSAINAVWQSKFIAHGGLGVYKRYRELHAFVESDGASNLIIKTGVLRANTTINSQRTHTISSDSLWDLVQWDEFQWSGGQSGIAKIRNLGRGHALKVEFHNNNATERPRVRQVTLFYDIFQKGRRE